MKSDRFFTQADLDAIRAAVSEAEKRTSGEIVPYVVDQSDEYASAAWKGAALGAILAPLVALAIHRWSSIWGIPVDWWIALPAPVGGALGYLLSLLPPVRRWMVGEEILEARTRRRAAVAFLDQEVFRTENRTGILLFVSLFERRVVVLGDSGINRQVEAPQWEAVVATVVAGIRSGRPGAALADGIRQCGELLARFGVAIQPDDSNELPDELRQGDV